MGTVIQLDFFQEPPSEVEIFRLDIKELEALIHRVRKGTYAEIGSLKKRVLSLEERLDIIERHICKGTVA